MLLDKIKLKNSKIFFISFFLFISIIWFFVFYIVIFSNIKENKILKVSQIYSLDVQIIIPQGWGFFTRNPRELRYQAYKKDTLTEVYNSVLKPNFHKSNYYGLSRKNRALQAQLMNLIIKDNNDSIINWDTSEDNIFNFLPKSKSNYLKVKNKYKYNLLCGDYVLVSYYPIPWSYSKFDIKNKSYKIYLEIECD